MVHRARSGIGRTKFRHAGGQQERKESGEGPPQGHFERAAHLKAVAVQGDVAKEADVNRIFAETKKAFGKLDILVNNAAYQQHQASPEELPDEQWDRTFKTNIYGYFRMVKAALPHLKEGSTIINTGSETGLEGNKQLLDYASTKGAIHAFTKSLAQMLVERGIRVNCIAPGIIRTLFHQNMTPEQARHNIDNRIPLHREGTVDDVAEMVLSLVTNDFITGETVTVDGGMTMRIV